MKRYLLLALVVLILLSLTVPATAVAQTHPQGGGWSEQTPSGGKWLEAVSFPDLLHGWAVGEDGTILNTSNGGTTWSTQNLGAATGWLNDVFFVDAQRGWVAGEKLWRTTNGGLTWTGRTLGTETSLRTIAFTDASHGWVAGEKLWRTDDGGDSWEEVTIPYNYAPDPMIDLSFTDAMHGWVLFGSSDRDWSYFTVRTSDGGETWSIGAMAGLWSPYARCMCATDESHAWLVGYDDLVATLDGGESWQLQYEFLWASDPQEVQFVDDQRGWVVGNWLDLVGDAWKARTIAGTADGGTTWTVQCTGSEGMNDVDFVDATHGWAVGRGGQILVTRTGGWSPPTTAVSGAVNGRWYNRPLTLLLTATAHAPSSSVVSLTYSLQGVGETVPGSTCVVPVGADAATHADDAAYQLLFGATDSSGYEESQQVLTFGIDTRRPSPSAPSSASARRGRPVTLKYKILDTVPNGGKATVTIKVKNRAGKVVRTLKPVVKPVNTALTWKFTVPRTWKRGTYRFYVYGTDTAGNKQANTATNKLFVK